MKILINKLSIRGTLLLLLVSLIGMGGCALPQNVDEGAQGKAAESEAGQAMHNELVAGMLQQKQYYAALAHVQELENEQGKTPELRYLEAEARRQLGQDSPAEALYKGLLRSDYAADAYHGLGLLYAKTDLKAAVGQLREAVQRRPTDAQMRNDLGYALMMGGRYQEALPELATAVELDPEGAQSLNNLIVLLMLTHDEAGVKRVAAQGGIDAAGVAELRKRAASLYGKPRK